MKFTLFFLPYKINDIGKLSKIAPIKINNTNPAANDFVGFTLKGLNKKDMASFLVAEIINSNTC